jgi:hypothetical protein
VRNAGDGPDDADAPRRRDTQDAAAVSFGNQRIPAREECDPPRDGQLIRDGVAKGDLRPCGWVDG